MAQQIIGDNDLGLTVRTKINENFAEIYDLLETMYIGYSSIVHDNIAVTTDWLIMDYIDTVTYETKITQANGVYSFTDSGGYTITGNASCRWDNSDEIELGIFKNGILEGDTRLVTGEGSNKDILVSPDFFLELLSTDTVDFRIKTVTGTSTIDIRRFDIILNRIF